MLVFPSLKRTLSALLGGFFAGSSVTRCDFDGFTFGRLYLGVATELGGAALKQSCQEWYEGVQITRNSAWGRLPNVLYRSIRTLMLRTLHPSR